jgi:hypothetical protein
VTRRPSTAGSEPAPDQHRAAEHCEVVGRDGRREDGIGGLALQHAAARVGLGGKVGERPALGPPVLPVGAGDPLARPAQAGRARIHRDQLLGRREGKRFPQLGVDDAEGSRGDGHAGGERQARRQRKQGLAAQAARPVFEVAPDLFEGGEDPDVARLFARERDVAHRAPRSHRRFGRRHAVGLERGLGPGAVVFELRGEVGVVVPVAPVEREAADETNQRSHAPIVSRGEQVGTRVRACPPEAPQPSPRGAKGGEHSDRCSV